jgi:hypothetical protein
MKQITSAWDNIRAGMRRLYPASNPHPLTVNEIFVPVGNAAADEIKLIVNPIIFHLPERAGRRGANLYIVVSGWLSFEKVGLRDAPLRTRGFGTQIGYFRAKQESLDHVYGAHYDIEEKQPGHPVFHSQMGPEMEFGEQIRATYTLTIPLHDVVSPILRNVRVPTAQMDVFSVIRQICADHLMSNASDQDVSDAFGAMVKSCGFFEGAAHRLPFLNSGTAVSCYRSLHWYSPPGSAQSTAAAG